MTLNDELLENLYRNSHDDSECLKIKFENIDVVLKGNEQIADDFAIGFAEWCIKWMVVFFDDTSKGILYTYGGMPQKYKMKELLEIYKKEKGL